MVRARELAGVVEEAAAVPAACWAMWQQYWRCCNGADSGGGGYTNAGGVDEATAVPAACWTMWQQYWR